MNKKNKLSISKKIEKSKLDIVKNALYFVLLPVVILIVGVILLTTVGFSKGIDFAGGQTFKVYVNDEGKLINYAKCRGRKAAMEHIVDAFCNKSGAWDNETVFIGHGDCAEDAKTLESMLKATAPQVKNVYTGFVGPVIGAHTGPGVLVVFFMGSQR